MSFHSYHVALISIQRRVRGGVAALGAGILILSLSASSSPQSATPTANPQSPLVPVALEWATPDQLLIAARDARALLLVDAETAAIVSTWPVPFRPATLLKNTDGGWIVGGQSGEVAWLDADGSLLHQIDLGNGSVRLAMLPNGQIAATALWERAVWLLDRLEAPGRYPLPFDPAEVVPLPGGQLLVADAFQGRLAILRLEADSEVSVFSLDAVNLRGFRLSPDGAEVFFNGLVSDGPLPLSATNLDWGLVLSSKLFALSLKGELAMANAAHNNHIEPLRLTLDGSGHGAADPSALAVNSDGSVLYIAARGAHEILEIDRRLGAPLGNGRTALGDRQRLRAVEVGQNPVDLALSPNGRQLATADMMSDTISILATNPLRWERTLRLSPAHTLRPPELRGEATFLDGRSSLDRWISCSSCHTEGHTIGLKFDTQGDGGYGDPKTTISLLGVGPTAPFGWTGRFKTLSAQVDKSLRTSLHGPDPTPEQVADLTTYLESLPPAPPVRPRSDPVAVRGEQLFAARRCDTCHMPPDYTSRALRDVGLDPNSTRYSVSALRGVSRSSPYLHDGSASTLDDLLDRHHPSHDEPPTPDERSDLAAFLESL